MVFKRFSGHFLLWPWPLNFWLNHMSQDQVYVWPNFGEINSNIYENIHYCIHPVFRFTACTDLDLWLQNLISTSTNPNTPVTEMGEIPFSGFWDMVFTRCLGQCLPWPWPYNPKFNRHTYEPKCIWNTKSEWNSLHLFFELWCSQVFPDAQTRSLTDRQTWLQNTSGTVFHWRHRHKN